MLPSIRMLRAARALLAWSQHKLAQESGVHPSVIGRIEGKNGSARSLTLERLAAAMEREGVVFFYESGMEGIKILKASPQDPKARSKYTKESGGS